MTQAPRIGRRDVLRWGAGAAALAAVPAGCSRASDAGTTVKVLCHPGQILPNAKLIAATLGLILVVKPLVTIGVALALRSGLDTALTVGAALSQIGEFSFILAALGRRLGVLPPEATQTLVAASILSITINPLLFRAATRAARRFARCRPFVVDAPLRSGRSTP